MTEKLKSNLQVWHLIVGFAVFALGGAISLGATFQALKDRLSTVEASAKVQDTILLDYGRDQKNMSDTLIEVRSDVAWIKKHLEK